MGKGDTLAAPLTQTFQVFDGNHNLPRVSAFSALREVGVDFPFLFVVELAPYEFWNELEQNLIVGVLYCFSLAHDKNQNDDESANYQCNPDSSREGHCSSFPQ